MTAISTDHPRLPERAWAAVSPAAATVRELAGLDDLALLEIFRSLPSASPRRAAACEVLVSRHRGLVRSCARRYGHSPETAGDLMQVGYVGLVKAIGRFDPAVGSSLASYAQATISGELKRHFRDKRWHAHVIRSVQELVVDARAAREQLIQELGRMPAEADMVRYLGVTAAELREAECAELAMAPWSLDAPLGHDPDAGTLADRLGGDDPAVEHMLGMRAVATHWAELPAREQKILVMRFRGDFTQAQIGAQLGISQMHVSRLQSRALAYLRPRVMGLPGPMQSAGRLNPNPLARPAEAREQLGSSSYATATRLPRAAGPRRVIT
jgi:RNA polymerase sigma-B factor